MKQSCGKTVAPPAIEVLEGRRMLSASLVKGILRVTGTAGDDVIRISRSGKSIEVDVNGVSQNFKASAVRGIRIRAGKGDDSVVVGPALASTISGGPGNDELIAGKAADSLDGGEGNDVLLGGGGSDTILGDGGDDTLDGLGGNDSMSGGVGRDNLSGGSGNDLLNGDDGHDTVSGGKGTDLSIDLEDRIADPDQADTDLNVFIGAFPGLANDLFPNGTGGGEDSGNGPIFGGGGSIFGGGNGSIFG
jgi:Ca2+-binding RTX toxin-like protein